MMLPTARGRVSRPAALFAAAAMLMGGCSSGSHTSDAESEKAGTPASNLCDGSLDAAAADALQRLAGAERFEEATGVNQAGRSNKFSVSRSVKHLHDEYRNQSECSIYQIGDDKPLFQVRFSASASYPSGNGDSGERKTRYPIGVFAQVGSNGADLFFHCPTDAPAKDAYIGDTDYVKAEMYRDTYRLRGDTEARDVMVILNSMARAVAEAAGCASQAGLPTRVPDAV
jgi:hypothetical protein